MRQKVVISKATIDRLPLYFRTLRVTKEEGREIISSEELGRRLGITPEQIRKDLASFGQFGKKGVGYYVHELMRNIGEILGLDNNWNIAVVGIGHLGAALANYQNFITLGFNLMALFDADEDVVGTIVNKVKVDHINDVNQVVKERNIHIGVIAVPAPFAQEVADKLVTAGVTGIWNFAPRKIVVPEHICIVNEDLSVGLSNLSYHITRKLL
ncbi:MULTISPECIES: redox-sensing transcriptional repressor Rex [Anaerosinus]|uniref:Redox-sensing transcriptional repressor Rex n=1 Tax=Selenobaculum gibii TaxID=3054208 RepID=A0A9Y2AJM2_9FIRM|nr:redox-sensing transcriptional repressor Rex [Selenobaculum gbiensis]WIW71384.1 redox-sensing transcriptional repressor Rex [Selenobaculum gbiensis]